MTENEIKLIEGIDIWHSCEEVKNNGITKDDFKNHPMIRQYVLIDEHKEALRIQAQQIFNEFEFHEYLFEIHREKSQHYKAIKKKWCGE